ncbi:MAG: lysophospholipid acyltransferase family protein [Lutimonas sp.]
MLTLEVMKWLYYFFILLWRIWFYLLWLVTILAALPILIIIISKEKWYPIFFKIAKYWAKTILFLMGFKPVITYEEKMDTKKSYVFCPNHTSIVDILLMLVLSDNPFVFLGKKELSKIPVFGYIYRKTCIMVDRENKTNKNSAFTEAQRRLANGLSVCIFPEGKVPDDESIILDNFKSGAFRLSEEFNIPIVPITFFDCKKRFSYTFFSGGPGVLRTKIHSFIQPTGKTIEELQQETFTVIFKSLKDDLMV